MPPDPENCRVLSDHSTARGALQAAHESLADYPAIVAMHEEQTERAEAEAARLRAALEEIASYHEHGRHSAVTPATLAAVAREALNGGEDRG